MEALKDKNKPNKIKKGVVKYARYRRIQNGQPYTSKGRQ